MSKKETENEKITQKEGCKGNGMKNNLVDLQNHLFTMIETLNNKELKSEDLKNEIERAMAITDIAKAAITNGARLALVF